MLFGPFFGHLADRVGRKHIIPLGILIGALAGAAFIPRAPLLWPVAITAVLSLGYDMSHPLLAGISTSLNPSRRGLAMGLNAFALFSGFGLGALAFEPLLKYGFGTALAAFALAQLCLAVLAVPLFRGEDSSAGDHSEIIGSDVN
jgi:MFS family permease